MNNLIYIVCNFDYRDISRELVLRDNFLYSFENEVKYRAFALPYLIVLIVFIFLTSQTRSEDVSLENEWLDFLSLGAKVAG